ncbi:hypothetical protein F4779DRAFT_400908 [Xylariaceae sp. FL0662B]|nr:hypothetical protein F4779DRAFT_400908 [Xylariaceae sp. FL0662B]
MIDIGRYVSKQVSKKCCPGPVLMWLVIFDGLTCLVTLSSLYILLTISCLDLVLVYFFMHLWSGLSVCLSCLSCLSACLRAPPPGEQASKLVLPCE